MIVVGESTPVVALNDAVARVGSQSALARLIGVSQQAVWKWLQSGKPLPAEHVLKVEAATGVSRHDLRPDLYPREPAPPAPPPPATGLGELEPAR